MSRARILTVVAAAMLAAQAQAAVMTVDLSVAGRSGWINGALFVQYDPASSTGTGVIDPFVRIQSNTSEQGYNTNAAKEFDEKEAHAILVGALPTTLIGGERYWQFLLDINENQSESQLSLDQLRIYISDSPTLSGYSAGFPAPIYDMNGTEAGNWVRLDADLSSGSGKGDMLLYVPVGANGDPTKYLYLYSSFGTNVSSDDGFEEWAYGVGGLVPEPGTIALLALSGLAALRRRA